MRWTSSAFTVIGGLTGCILTGLLATVSVNSAAHNGWLNGGSFKTAMLPQLEDAGSTILIAVIGTIIIAMICKVVCGGLRSTEEEEDMGLDVTDHGEVGYSNDTTGTPVLAGTH